MAGIKISDLTELTQPSAADVVPIVDVDAGPAATKKVRFDRFTGDAINVKSFGAAGDNTGDDGPAFNDAIAAMGTGGTEVRKALYVPPGKYRVTTPIDFGTRKAWRFFGAGKDVSVINYQGTGVGVSVGAPGTSMANARILLENLGLDGNASAVGGLRIQRCQDYMLRNFAIGQTTGFTAAGAYAYKSAGTNGGQILNCDFRRSKIGALLVEDEGGTPVEFSNQIEIRGGQVTANDVGIVGGSSVGASQACLVSQVNIAAGTASPQVDLRRTTGWMIFANHFESALTAAGASAIRVGNVSQCTGTQIWGNSFFETNTDYLMDIVNGGGTVIFGNFDGSSGLTNQIRLGASTAQTWIWGHPDWTVEDNTGAQDTWLMGFGGNSEIRKVLGGMRWGPEFAEYRETSDPAAPATNGARLYARDSGGGKTQLVVRFPTGAIQVLATEP